jgi:hypothetical protein
MISAAVSPYALAQKLGWFGERGVKMMVAAEEPGRVRLQRSHRSRVGQQR